MASPIEFQGYRIEKFEYNREIKNKNTSASSGYFKPKVDLRFDKDYKEGLVILSIYLEEKAERQIFLQLHGFFTILDERINNDQAGELLAMNGTSMLMPYARSIISMVTALDSPRAMIVPTVNVQELFGQK